MKTILVIEKHPNLRRLYVNSLSGIGYNVLTAWEPAQAREKIALGDPDLIVVDPRLGDEEEERSLSRLLDGDNLPPILYNLSSHDTGDGLGSLRTGYQLLKTSDVAQLERMVEVALSRN